MAEQVPNEVIIDLADFRLSRTYSRNRLSDQCKHMRLTFESHERTVHCEDCQRDLEPFTAFLAMANVIERVQSETKRLKNIAKAACDHALVSRAAKHVDEVWRGRTMAPCCPHCSRGLLPEDFVSAGGGMVSREYEIARRQRDAQKPAAARPGAED